MRIAQKFRELLDRINQNKLHIYEMLAEDEKIKESIRFHWFAHIIAFKSVFIMAVLILLYCLYQQLSWYNKAIMFLAPIFLASVYYETSICVAFGIFELLTLIFPIYFLSFGSVIAVAYTLYVLLELQAIKVLVTNKRIICRTGILRFRIEELSLSRIKSINVKQSIFGRLFNYATIIFSGVGTAKVEFEGVADPWAVKSRIESIINGKG